MSYCKLYLDNENRTFSNGALITGRLECYFTDKTTVRGVKVRLQCKEHNEWKSGKTPYSGSNYIMRIEHMLVDSETESSQLSSGEHVYPFSVKLPEDIPSSFQGPYGSIYYKLKGIVDRPFKFDYEDTCYFRVNSLIDITKMPRRFQEPAIYSGEKNVCDWCCQGGKITMDVKLSKLAFTPEETINLTVDVCNMSNTNVEQLKVTLKKTLIYKVNSTFNDSRKDDIPMESLRKPGVGAHNQNTYNLELTVPRNMFIPNFAECTLFEVGYLLKVSCKMPFCTKNLNLNIWDIMMGHISCRQTVDLSPSYPSSSTAFPSSGKHPTAPPLLSSAAVYSARPSAPLKEDPPPSYNETQFASTSETTNLQEKT